MAPGSRTSIAVLAALLLAPVRAPAQPETLPPIGTIDFYGLRTILPQAVEARLPYRVGDELREPVDPEPIASALDVERVELSYVCCTADGLFQIYVGVQEEPGPAMPYLPAPSSDVRLPAAMLADFDELLRHLADAVVSGQATEDDSEGHALSAYPPMRRVEERLIVHAANDPETLLRVLSESADAHERAAAAHILGYSADKAAVVPPLAEAVLDPDDEVRNYATRALAVIAQFATAHPELGIEIPADPFVGMLSSIVWSDRNKGLAVMAQLTTGRDPALLGELRETSLDSLIEMCGWQHWGHAVTACLILQRILDMPDAATEESRAATLARADELRAARPAASH